MRDHAAARSRFVAITANGTFAAASQSATAKGALRRSFHVDYRCIETPASYQSLDLALAAGGTDNTVAGIS